MKIKRNRLVINASVLCFGASRVDEFLANGRRHYSPNVSFRWLRYFSHDLFYVKVTVIIKQKRFVMDFFRSDKRSLGQ